MAKPSKDHVELFHDYGIYIPNRTIVMESCVDDDGDDCGVNYLMATQFLKNFQILEHMNKEPITIILNTVGGDVSQGMAIYDTIKQSDCHVTMKVRGNAQSMGSVLLQAADTRMLQPHSQIMFHLGSPDVTGLNIHEVLNGAKHEIDFGKKIDDILYARIKEKYDAENKAFTRHKFNDMNIKGAFLSAQQAIDLGLADTIEGAQ